LVVRLSDLDIEDTGQNGDDRSHEQEVHLVAGIELDDVRWSLWRGPEEVSTVVSVVSWEAVQELGDLVMEDVLEQLSGDVDQSLGGWVWPAQGELGQESEFVQNGAGLVLALVNGLLDISSWVSDQILEVGGSISEQSLEVVSGPFDGVVQQVWVVSQGAHWDGVFLWILRITVGLGLVWDDHLRVALGSQSTGFEQVLLVEDTLSIDILSSLDVVDGTEDTVEIVPEDISEDVFGVWSSSLNLSVDVQAWVDGLGDGASGDSLGLGDMLLSEQELSVQVGDFDGVIISDGQLTISSRGDTHQSELLQVFATQSTCADHEDLELS
jgi:hypothetical protein